MSKISIDADSLLYHATSLNLVGSAFYAISSALEAHSSERPERFSANCDPGSLLGRLNKAAEYCFIALIARPFMDYSTERFKR